MYGSKCAVLPQGGQALIIVGVVCTYLDWMYVVGYASYAININCVFDCLYLNFSLCILWYVCGCKYADLFLSHTISKFTGILV